MRWLACALVVAGCGGAPLSGVGTSHAPREDDPGVHLQLRTSEGRTLEIEDQRGSPVLLFLFATYDGASLASARGLSRFARTAADTVVVAVAVQLQAEIFVPRFVESLGPPYTVTWDERETVVHGTSGLGAIEVPTFVMLDARGIECARHTGYTSERELWEMRDVALSRGGITAPPPPEPVVVPELPPEEPELPPEDPTTPLPPPDLREGEIVNEPDDARPAEPLSP